MYNFDFNFPTDTIIIFSVAAALVLLLILIYFRPLWKVTNAIRRQTSDPAEPSGSIPVSVVIFASDDAESLRHLLPAVLGQKYNGNFEVIVVNEGQSDATAEVVERLKIIHDNLYLTYTPDGARQLSRKKLGLMIGIKAARYPVVVHTTARAEIDSDEWLARMTEPFLNPRTEIVLGHSYLDPKRDRGIGRRSRTFNASADSAVWLASAVMGRPYRGTELNLAYTRDIFFNNRGFSRSLNLKHGDDDIFISEIARPDNTAVVLHKDAMVRSNARNVARAYSEQRSRYNFTGRHIPHTPRLLQGAGALLMWIILGLCIWGALGVWPNLAGAAVGAFIVVSTAIASIIIWRRAINALTGKKMLLTLPWLMLFRPLANCVASAKAMRHRKYNYTWN